MIDVVPEPSRHDHGDLGEAIDLGEREWDPDETGRPWRPAGLAVAAKIAVVVLLTLVALPASATSAVNDLGEPLWSGKVAWDGFSLGRELVFLRDGRDTVSARDARTGQERWRLQTPDEPLNMVELPAGVSAIFSGDRTGEGEWSMFVVDSLTGAVVAEFPGVDTAFAITATPPGGDRAMLYEYIEEHTAECPAGGCVGLTVIDLPTTAPVWRVVTPPGSGLAPAYVDDGTYGLIDGFAILDPAGRASVYEGNSPQPVASFAIDTPFTSTVLTKDALVVTTERDGQVQILAYGRRTGERLWQTTAPPGLVTPNDPWFYVHHCDQLVCAVTAVGTTLIDPASGRAIATIDDQSVVHAGQSVIVTAGGPQRSGPTMVVAIRDATDARIIRDIPDAAFIDWAGAGREVLFAQEIDGGTRLVLVDDRGATRVLGTIRDRVLQCAARDELLACHHDFGEVRIWRVPRGS